MGKFSVIAVIPALNEALTIAQLVKKASQHCPVLVIDDCSDDNTRALADNAGAKVLSNEQREGYAKSLNIGISWASQRNFDAVIFLDADGEHSPSLLPDFKEAIFVRNHDIVFGIREKIPRVTERLFGIWFRLRFGVLDPLCGMKAVKVSVWLKHGPIEEQNTIGTQMYFRALKSGASYTQLNVVGDKRTDGSRFGSKFRANIKILLGFIWLLISG